MGVDSKDDLLKSKLGEYGEMQHGWTAEEAKGFVKVLSTPLRVTAFILTSSDNLQLFSIVSRLTDNN